jgi:hypothetical protein
MRMHPRKTGVVCVALLVVTLASLALAGGASAKLTGEFKKFEFCPYTDTAVERCINALTTGGEVVLGSKKVVIEKQVTIQGGYKETTFEGPEGEYAEFVAATNGITLSKAPQNVPGGLAGVVPETGTPALVKVLIKFFFENKITGLTSTLELAKPASDIRISEIHLSEGIGVAMKLPVKVHLENPFLGKSCYVGSSTSPIKWELTTGATSPPAPNTSISGKIGEFEFLESARVLKIKGNELVDNAWSAPGASGCGGIISFLINPIINSQLGSTTAGHNSARLKNEVSMALRTAVKKNNDDNP